MFFMNKEKPEHWQKWNESIVFQRLWTIVRDRTLVDPLKLYTLWELAKTCESIEGEAAEFGVYRGGTARIISEVMKGKTTHLFDTFKGLPAPTEKDQMGEGELAADEGEVREFLKTKNVEFHVGFFPNTTMGLEDKRFCFVHSDCDLYQSTMDACNFFYLRLSACGIMVFDDYGFSATQGCTLAVDEFFSDKPECPVYLTTCQAVVIKQG